MFDGMVPYETRILLYLSNLINKGYVIENWDCIWLILINVRLDVILILRYDFLFVILVSEDFIVLLRSEFSLIEIFE